MYAFSILDTKEPHDKLKFNLSSIVDFAFNAVDKTFIKLFKNRAAYWVKKTKGGLRFSKKSIKKATNRLTTFTKGFFGLCSCGKYDWFL